MADHRAEQIMAAFEALVTSLATTGSNVTRARIYPNQSSALPALSVYQGDDEPKLDHDDDAVLEYIDHILEVIIEAHVQASSGIVDTTLNQIRKEIAVVVHADHKIGLSFVINTIEGPAEAPELFDEGEKRTAVQRNHYFVKYRRSRTDPSA